VRAFRAAEVEPAGSAEPEGGTVKVEGSAERTAAVPGGRATTD